MAGSRVSILTVTPLALFAAEWPAVGEVEPPTAKRGEPCGS